MHESALNIQSFTVPIARAVNWRRSKALIWTRAEEWCVGIHFRRSMWSPNYYVELCAFLSAVDGVPRLNHESNVVIPAEAVIDSSLRHHLDAVNFDRTSGWKNSEERISGFVKFALSELLPKCSGMSSASRLREFVRKYKIESHLTAPSNGIIYRRDS